MENGKVEICSKMFRVVTLLLTAFCFLLTAQAQDDQPPKDLAPPPLKIISKDERNLLDAEKNSKKHLQLSLDLMDTRLKSAEELVTQNRFQESINELGSFQAHLENALNYLTRTDNGSSKADDNYKRLEINLRKTVSRLEIVRRELPFSYGYYVQKIQKFVREARAKAIEPLFGDTVLPERKP